MSQSAIYVRRSVHPFPARMAPELAIRELTIAPPRVTVLDPMSGSGTVVREATRCGHRAIGLDCDPLAVLMARVLTTPVDIRAVHHVAKKVLDNARLTRSVRLRWIDDDAETTAFTKYWFGKRQRLGLRRLAYSIAALSRRRATDQAALNVARLALSRIIVTKDVGASLGRDISHSRPHRVADESDYDVFGGFEKAIQSISEVLLGDPPQRGAIIKEADARRMSIRAGSVDLVITSPPYLNAIDYLRGHRLSLIWLGYQLKELRSLRSSSVGAERSLDAHIVSKELSRIRDAIAPSDSLSRRHLGMVERFAWDLSLLMNEIRRVLRRQGRAVLVVGNSTLRGQFIQNSEGVKVAASLAGLNFESEDTRELPENRRYLPLRATTKGSLSKRMRTENILRFVL
jgi:hypothetical protein